jgi:hypothetical protein
MDKHHSNKLLILVCFAISAVSVFFILKSLKNQPSNLSNHEKPAYVPPVAVADSPKLSTIEAPDGKNKLVAKEEKTKDGVNYVFSVVNEATGVSKTVLTKSVPVGTVISIPFNTFSPDDKYIFLKEVSPSGTTFIVPVGDQTFDVVGMFAEKHPDFIVTDVTGWGGMTLLVVNTDKKSGGQGPSFWFDVTSKSFIQLNNRFN